MKKIFLLLSLLLLSGGDALFAQKADWQPVSEHGDSGPYYFLMKQDNNITYFTDSTLNAAERNHAVAITNKHIAKDLELLQEKEFSNPVVIRPVSGRHEMYKLFEKKDLYTIEEKEQEGGPFYLIVYVHDGNHCPLNLGLMKVIATTKWGKIKDDQLTWLKEGLASYATPEAYGCDGHNFAERYADFLGRKKSVNLLQFPKKEERLPYKIACNQAAYVVEYLMGYYGIGKLKELWQSRMADFETIYGMTFGDLTEKINEESKELTDKDIILFPFNWYDFCKDCIDPQSDEWFPAYNPSGGYRPEMEKMVTQEVGNLRFTVLSETSLSERKDLIAKTNRYIEHCLELINELPFNDSIHLFLIPKENDIGYSGGLAIMKEYDMPEGSDPVAGRNRIYTTYGALGHEIMHMVVYFKWATPAPSWLNEGLATLACPEAEGYGERTFEERYVHFLQTGKLLVYDDTLMSFKQQGDGVDQRAIYYNQSAFIVEYLLDNYGTEKLKRLWQNGMREFEKIYGVSIEGLFAKINLELNTKYPEPMEFNWDAFLRTRIE